MTRGILGAVGAMLLAVAPASEAATKQARDTYQDSLQGIVAEQSAANAKLMVCLDNNTAVLEDCRDELRHARLERSKT